MKINNSNGSLGKYIIVFLTMVQSQLQYYVYTITSYPSKMEKSWLTPLSNKHKIYTPLLGVEDLSPWAPVSTKIHDTSFS